MMRTQRAFCAITSLLCCGDDGAIHPLQDQAHRMGILAILDLAGVSVLTEQAFLYKSAHILS